MEGRGSALLLADEDVASANKRVEAFVLCRTFGWTWDDLERIPSDVADDFLYILTHGKHQAPNRD